MLLGACAPPPVEAEPTQETPTSTPSPLATSTPTSTLTATLTPTVTLTPTKTPFPAAYDQSQWTISLESLGWEGIKHVTELDDGNLLVVGSRSDDEPDPGNRLIKLSRSGQIL